MRSSLIKIGNSQGIRLPKLLLDEVGLRDVVELEAKADHLVIRPITEIVRKGWDEMLKNIVSPQDTLLDEGLATGSEWDELEWQW